MVVWPWRAVVDCASQPTTGGCGLCTFEPNNPLLPCAAASLPYWSRQIMTFWTERVSPNNAVPLSQEHRYSRGGLIE